MPKVKYDVSNVDDQSDFKQAPVGLYVLKVAEFNEGESKAGQPMGTIVFDVVKDGKGKKLKESYGRVWHRVPLEHSDDTAGWTFRLKEFIKALGLKEKGSFDTDKIVGTEMLGKLAADKDLDDNYRPKVGKLMPLDSDADEDDEPDDEPDEDDDEDEGDDEDYTADDLKELDDDDLKEVAKDEFELKVPKGDLDKKKRKKLIAAILEAQEEAEDEDEDEDDDDEEEDQYDDMSKSQLVKEARSRKIKVKSSHDEDDIRALLRDDDEEDDDDGSDDDDDDDEEEEGEDYSEWSVEKLKDELKERGLKTSGSKKVLSARLEKDDEEDDDDGDPF